MTDIPPPRQERDRAVQSGTARMAGGPQVCLKVCAERFGRHPALCFRGRTQSYEQLNQAVLRRAAALQSLGLVPGEAVGLLTGDTPALIQYDLAARAAGIRPVLLDPAQAPQSARERLSNSGAHTIVASDTASSYARATQLLAFSSIDRIVVVPFASQVSTLSAVGLRLGGRERLARVQAAESGAIIREADLLRTCGAASPIDAAPATDPAALNVSQVLAALPDLPDEGRGRIVAAVPLADPLALRLVVGLGLVNAAAIVIPDELEPAAIVRALGRQDGGVLITSPARLGKMLAVAGPAAPAWRDLKLALLIGGEPTAEVAAAFAAVTPAPLRSIYSARGAAAAIGDARDGVPAGAYRPLTDTRIVVRDIAERTREVPQGERGALYVAGPQYDAAGTALPTGDVGLIDSSGQVVVIDRIDELVVAAGYMIYPRRIEAALRALPGVAEAAVVGVDDGKRGMAPKAFVIPKPGVAVTEHALMTDLSARISKIELPAAIEICPALPRDAFGEIDRRALQQGD